MTWLRRWPVLLLVRKTHQSIQAIPIKTIIAGCKRQRCYEIEGELKYQPGLSNNHAVHGQLSRKCLPSTINFIKRAIMILGHKQLQRWIQILLYAVKQKDGSASHDKNHQDRAFMVGVLSLLDTLLGIEMSNLVGTLSIQKYMCEALLTRRGYLGRQLALIEAHERGEFETVSSMLAEPGFLSIGEFTRMDLEAAAWANWISDAINQQ